MTRLFPLWAIGLSVVAYFFPQRFKDLAPAIPILLGVVMLGMGLTLTGSSFRAVFTRPRVVLTGVGLQFGVMPLAALMAAKIFGLNAQLTAGLVLVGSCPGGTASNVITYLAGGAVALSITLTAVSTLLSVVATPTITWLLVGQSVPVPALSMLRTIFVIVIVPVTVGVIINQRWGNAIERVKRFSPAVSVSAIVLIIAIVVAGNRNELAGLGSGVLFAVALHNVLGLGAGYGLSKLLRFTEAEARTIAIEVGMQNSGLGVVLSHRYFSAVAALPGAVFSIWHNLTGSILASRWSNLRARGARGGLE